MDVGVFSLMQWPLDRSAARVYGDELAQVVEAERLGFDRAWFAEHHFSRYGIDPAIHLTMAHAAARGRGTCRARHALRGPCRLGRRARLPAPRVRRFRRRDHREPLTLPRGAR